MHLVRDLIGSVFLATKDRMADDVDHGVTDLMQRDQRDCPTWSCLGCDLVPTHPAATQQVLRREGNQLKTLDDHLLARNAKRVRLVALPTDDA
jgi:hypothetical protein